MKTGKQKKAGFTLVELMVVAIIVAILAAVAIPLMTGNRERAMSTEAQGGCTTVATALKVHIVEAGAATTDITALSSVNVADLAGTYYSGYVITSAVDQNNFVITATARATPSNVPAVQMSVVNGVTTWL